MSERFIRSGVLLAWVAVLGCTQVSSDRVDTGPKQSEPALAVQAPQAGPFATRATSGIAALPDNGQLLAYGGPQGQRGDAPVYWHPVRISEAHALNAIHTRKLQLTTPDGETLLFAYARHVEHSSGDWTWVGRLKKQGKPVEAIITFGPKAVFGVIDQLEGPPLRIRSRRGATWVVAADPTRIADLRDGSAASSGPDYLLPPRAADGVGMSIGGSTALAPSATTPSSALSSGAAATVIDALLGYTAGFAAATGGPSQAVTQLNNMVEVANQAYVNSQVDVRLRLVHAMQVEYTDLNTNETALRELTGTDGKGNSVPIPASLQALRAAREQYGADVVSLVRKFQTPEQGGCGIAWLLGGGNRGEIRASEQAFAYSIVGDGTDPGDDGKTYFCRAETLAHEIGHTMGSQHDRATATDGTTGAVSFGVFPYSFGYKTSVASGDFYTVMAYSDKRESPPFQRSYRVFSNPRITYCGGFSCGVEEQADNARSMANTGASVSRFRTTIVPNVHAKPDLVVFSKLGFSGTTEVHTLSGSATYQAFLRHSATSLHPTGSDGSWELLLGDYNRDGAADVYAISKMGASGRTEVHVLDGARGLQSFALHVATALHQTGSDRQWVFRLGDRNRDGVLDIYAINRAGASGRTEVHVLDGANNFQTFLVHVATVLHASGSRGEWAFDLGDQNGDGILDLYTIAKSGWSDSTEVHVLDGASMFQRFLTHRATALPQTGVDERWVFRLADYDGDGTLDIFCINRTGASGRTEVHVLDGRGLFSSFLAHVATALHPTGVDNSWAFEVAASR